MSKEMRRMVMVLLVLTVSFMFFIGCAKPPTQEMESAEKALTEAKAKEADLYVPDLFKKAEDALKKAKDFVAQKSYKEAKAAAEEAAQTAGQAVAAIEASKARMKQEAAGMVEEAEKSLAEIKTLTATAIKKKVQINREEWQGMIGKAEVDLISVKNTLQEQKIRPAYDQVKAILAQLKAKTGEMAALLGMPVPGAAATAPVTPAAPATPAAKK
ncbi:MAG TPA: DUF4398 domain-containing protein [Syntrophales bacterium]|jgi:hypothetical protein|nr:DUF4398 domain-containing protein [Syntrophales bacterium]